MRLATWNLNNRVGLNQFYPDLAHAAVTLGAEVMVFTEYYPHYTRGDHHRRFREVLREAGWAHQLISTDPGPSPEKPRQRVNHVLIASRLPLESEAIALPAFDRDAASNAIAAYLPTVGLHLLGLRIPDYTEQKGPKLAEIWGWLHATAAMLRDKPGAILGDFNVSLSRQRDRTRKEFLKLLDAGWVRAQPSSGHSYFGIKGTRSEIDHLLVTKSCSVEAAMYLTAVGGYILANGTKSLSDHAALVAEINVPPAGPPGEGGPP